MKIRGRKLLLVFAVMLFFVGPQLSLAHEDWPVISAGGYYAMAVRADGTVYETGVSGIAGLPAVDSNIIVFGSSPEFSK